jgi:hypothetical protein
MMTTRAGGGGSCAASSRTTGTTKACDTEQRRAVVTRTVMVGPVWFSAKLAAVLQCAALGLVCAALVHLDRRRVHGLMNVATGHALVLAGWLVIAPAASPTLSGRAGRYGRGGWPSRRSLTRSANGSDVRGWAQCERGTGAQNGALSLDRALRTGAPIGSGRLERPV